MSGNEPAVSFEAAVEKLQQTVKLLESGELSLEKALQAFEEGVKLSRICQEQLKAAEAKIEILTQAGSTVEVKPFPAPRA